MNTSPRNFGRAIVRRVPETFSRCIQPHGGSRPIDLRLAQSQHAAYCEALERLGLELVRLDPDDRFPDCCFVEDTAIVVGDIAVVCEIGVDSRRGEEEAVVDALFGHRIFRLEPPAAIDGGDAMLDGDRLYVGLTERTNGAAVRQLERILVPAGIDVVAVPVSGVLHLKSACTPVAPGVILISESFEGENVFADFERLVVPDDERYAANCLSANGTVILSRGYPKAKAVVENSGFNTITLDMSEFRSCGGSLTCLSILL